MLTTHFGPKTASNPRETKNIEFFLYLLKLSLFCPTFKTRLLRPQADGGLARHWKVWDKLTTWGRRWWIQDAYFSCKRGAKPAGRDGFCTLWSRSLIYYIVKSLFQTQRSTLNKQNYWSMGKINKYKRRPFMVNGRNEFPPSKVASVHWLFTYCYYICCIIYSSFV